MRNRKSLRLPDFDYSQDGAYFITIVTQNRVCLFGDIIKGIMVSNDAGKMIEGVCKELSEFIRGVELNPYQIMPNHFHATVIINQSRDVGATLCGCPGQTRRSAPTGNRISLPNVVQRFKSLTTQRYINGVFKNHWQRFEKRLWQRYYYEHIIRNEREYQAIADYIRCNPQNWLTDKNHSSSFGNGI